MKNLFKCAALVAAIVCASSAMQSCKKDDPLKEIAIETTTTSYDIAQGEELTIPYTLKEVRGYEVSVDAESSDSKYTVKVSQPTDDAGTIKVTAPEYIIANNTFTVTFTVTDSVNNRTSTTTYTINAKVDARFVEVTAPANCFVVAPGKIVKIPASIGNSSEFASYDSVELMWQNTQGLVTKVSKFDDKSIIVNLGDGKSGSALIAAKSGDTFVWNWHIWVSDFNPDAKVMSYTSSVDNVVYNIMDRNIGARGDSGTDAFGTFYQFGRKEPIPADTASVYQQIYDINNTQITMAYAPTAAADNHPNGNLNPATIYLGQGNSGGNYNWLSNDKTLLANYADYWGGVSGKKAVSDPCPAGWRVAPLNAFYCLADAEVEGGMTRTKIYDANGTGNANRMGTNVSLDGGKTNFFFPLPGEIMNSAKFANGYNGTATWPCGKMWAAEYDASGNRFRAAQVSPSSVTLTSGLASSYAISVRCVKE